MCTYVCVKIHLALKLSVEYGQNYTFPYTFILENKCSCFANYLLDVEISYTYT